LKRVKWIEFVSTQPFNIRQVEMDRVIFVSLQHNLLIKRVKWVVLYQSVSLTSHIQVKGS